MKNFLNVKDNENLRHQFNFTCSSNKITQSKYRFTNLPNVMLNMVDALSSLFLFEKKLSAEAVVHKFGVLKDFKKIIGKGRLRSLF